MVDFPVVFFYVGFWRILNSIDVIIFFREYNKFGQWKGASFLMLPTLADQNACLQRNKDVIGDTGRYIEGKRRSVWYNVLVIL